MTQKTIPVLPMLNTKETIKFYEINFEFSIVDLGGYLTMEKDGLQLHFYLCADKYLCANARCYISVNNIEDLYIELCGREIIQLKGKLEDKPSGKKEFTVWDNNGNTLRFVEEKNNL